VCVPGPLLNLLSLACNVYRAFPAIELQCQGSVYDANCMQTFAIAAFLKAGRVTVFHITNSFAILILQFCCLEFPMKICNWL
jgi:hypothetical protein